MNIDNNLLQTLIKTNKQTKTHKKTSLFFAKMSSSGQKNQKKKNEGYEPRITICLLSWDSAVSVIWVCLKFAEQLSWQLHFYASLLVWDQKQDSEKSSLSRNRKHRKVKFCSHLHQKKKKKSVGVSMYVCVCLCVCMLRKK